MILYYALCFLALLFGVYSSFKDKDIYLYIAFFIIACLIGLQNDCGTDIPNYRKIFEAISQDNHFNFSIDENLYSKQFNIEIGWALLCRIFSHIGGFRLLLIFTSFFNMAVAVWLISKWVPSKFYWFSVFIIIFMPGYLTFYSSGIRQTLAIFIILISFDLQWSHVRYRHLFSLLLIIIASTIHFTALIALPFVFIPSCINYKSLKPYFWLIGGMLVFIYTILAFTPAGEFLDRIIYLMDLSGVEGYDGYIKKASEFNSYSLLHFGFYFAIIVLLYYTSKDYFEEYLHYQPIILLALIVLLFVPIFRFGGALYRVVHYIDFCCILAYPLILNKFRTDLIVTTLFCLFFSYRAFTTFFGFFNTEQGQNYHLFFISFN